MRLHRSHDIGTAKRSLDLLELINSSHEAATGNSDIQQRLC